MFSKPESLSRTCDRDTYRDRDIDQVCPPVEGMLTRQLGGLGPRLHGPVKANGARPPGLRGRRGQRLMEVGEKIRIVCLNGIIQVIHYLSFHLHITCWSIYFILLVTHSPLHFYLLTSDSGGQTDKQVDRHVSRQVGRQAGRQAGRQDSGKTIRQACR